MGKPFDLEKAEQGEKVVTRDGRAVKFIAHVPEAGATYRVVALIDGTINGFYESGYYVDGAAHFNDLFMDSETHVGYVNVFVNASLSAIRVSRIGYETESDAKYARTALYGMDNHFLKRGYTYVRTDRIEVEV